MLERRRQHQGSPKQQTDLARLRHSFRVCVHCWKEAFDGTEPGSEYVLQRHRTSNPRTQLTRIVRHTGLKPWPRIFHNLRASRETEFREEFPAHGLATAWTWPTNTIFKSPTRTSNRRRKMRRSTLPFSLATLRNAVSTWNRRIRRRMKKPLCFKGLRAIATVCGVRRKSREIVQREWMGIEPTRPLFRTLTGFEAQGGHQIRVHSPNRFSRHEHQLIHEVAMIRPTKTSTAQR